MMKLFTKVINGLKTVIHKAHKENESIFEIEIVATCFVVFYYWSNPMIKKTHLQEKATTLKKWQPKI